MRIFDLSQSHKGWFIGDFEPSELKTPNCEVAIRSYEKGQKDPWHYHKIATEVTFVLQGRVRMMDTIVEEGQGIVLEPGDGSAFEALEDSRLCIVKIPSIAGDKYEQ